MTDFDKTKENIRLHELDDFQRKELFNKFTDAGGKVLSDREKRRSLIIDRERQAEHRRRLDEHYRKNKEATKQKTIERLALPRENPGRKTRKEKADFFDRFLIRMRLRLYGVTKFNTTFFKPDFFVRFDREYRQSLLELQLAYFYFFKENPERGDRILRRLDKVNPVYYEVIEKLGEIFDQMKIDQILEHFRRFPGSLQSPSELSTPLTELFRSIYIVKPYENSAYAGFEKTLEIFEKVSEEKNKNFTKRRIKNALFIVFHRLFPRLHTLFCHYQNFLFKEIDSGIEDLLSIAPAEMPGNRKLRSLSKNYGENESFQSPRSSEEKTPDYLDSKEDPLFKKGLNIMSEVDLSESIRDLLKQKECSFLDDRDPVLKSYLFFLEFDKEYAFILTSNKIKFKVDFIDHDRIDYRQRMHDSFNDMKECQEVFSSYLESCLTYEKIRSQKPMIQDQYIVYSKRLDAAGKRKAQIGRTVYSTIRKFMEKLVLDFTALVDDMDGDQNYIENPQEVLTFDYAIEGEKKLNEMKVYEAISHVASYAMAFARRLGEGGDLRERSQFILNNSAKEEAILEEETKENFEIEENKNDDSPEGGDILSELEDLL